MTVSSPATDAVGERYAFAEQTAIAAGKTARHYFDQRETLIIEKKDALQDLVSQADRNVELEIRAAIRAQFPEDSLLGEEHGLEAGKSGFVWVIDPIDGTSPFLVGQPNWCVSIGLCQGEERVAGVIHAPILHETYRARRGDGAYLNDRRLQIDPDASLKTGNTAFGATHRADPDACGKFIAGLYHEGGVVFRIGSGALMLGYVAAGRLSGYFDPHIYAWDCYAGIVLVEEAGGVVDYAGGMNGPGLMFSGTQGTVDNMIRLWKAATD